MPIISNPTLSDVHVNEVLTDFAMRYTNEELSYVSASGVMPNIPVAKKTDIYRVYNRADWFRDQARELAPGAETVGGGYRFGKKSFEVRVWGFHKDVDDQTVANADSDLADLYEEAAEFCTEVQAIRKESLWYDTFFKKEAWYDGSGSSDTSNIWRQDLSDDSANILGNTAGHDQWDNANSNPIEFMRKTITAAQRRTGYRMNSIAFNRLVLDALLDNDTIDGKINGGATINVAAIPQVGNGFDDMALLRLALGVQGIYVLDSIMNDGQPNNIVDDPNDATDTPDETAAELAEFDFRAGNHALLFYSKERTRKDKPMAGVSFSWNGYMGSTATGLRILQIRNELAKSTRIDSEQATEYMVISSLLGAFVENVISG